MRRPAWSLVGILPGLLALVLTGLVAGPVAAAPAAPPSASIDRDDNVEVFDPSMPVAEIQAVADRIYARQVDAEMGSGRYALLFTPGTYGSAQTPLNIKVGYYTEVAGLGAFPGSVVINGRVEVFNRCFDNGCFALNNFWRSLSNLTINVTGGEGCRSGANFWAVSQASPMRRVDIKGGNLSLMDYCGNGPYFASGGFIADSRAGTVINGSQQQWLTRNSQVGSWSNGVWNQVFSGVQGAPAPTYPTPDPYTVVPATPVSREKPYLYIDDTGTWQVFVPAARTNSTGPSWTAGPVQGRSVPLSEFTIASPKSNWSLVNAALAQGRNVLLLPGRYDAAKALVVKRANTVVLGLGLPSITPTKGNAAIEVDNVPGVMIAGLTVDAGARNSDVLMRIGTGSRGPVQDAKASDPANPTTLSDVFFRIGGPQLGRATVALEVNSNDVVLDDIWAWRADHGKPGSVGWTLNTSDTGVVVNGNDVTATGLFSEHFQKDNVIWTGERGQTIFFQNELPYDAPDQAAWQHDGILGYAGYKVADSVKTHELWGGGSYIYTNVDPTLHATHGFEVPVTPGVKLHDLVTVSLNNAGTIDHIVNDTGPPATPSPDGSTVQYLASYP